MMWYKWTYFHSFLRFKTLFYFHKQGFSWIHPVPGINDVFLERWLQSLITVEPLLPCWLSWHLQCNWLYWVCILLALPLIFYGHKFKEWCILFEIWETVFIPVEDDKNSCQTNQQWLRDLRACYRSMSPWYFLDDGSRKSSDIGW